MQALYSLLASMAFALPGGPAADAPGGGFVAGADHVSIHYLQSGPAHAAHTLLLIPGWRISAAIWSKQIAYFGARGYRVVAMDSRSQGESSVTTAGNAPENRAADIRQVIAGLQLEHTVIVGWSQGAQDVAAYVDRYGTGAIDGCVLVDSPVSAGPDDVTGNPGFLKIILQGAATYSRDPRGYTDGMLHAIITAPTPPEIFAQLDHAALKTPTDIGIAMLLQDMFTVDRRPALRRFARPTLLVAAGSSPLLEAQRNMLKMLPHAKFVVVDGAAHAVFFDRPEVFDRALETFIASIDAGHG